MGRLFKRLLDVFASLMLLLAVSPILIIIAVLVKLTSKGPVLFVQPRAGKDGVPFAIFKFRTMEHDLNRKEKGVAIGDSRITKVGHFLREWSLDEFPQLINVLKGEMSLVGPRPLLISYVDRYTHTQSKRLSVPPGITGFQQVKCRYNTTWERKFAYDHYYAKNFSFWFDIKILLLTVKIIFFRPDSAKSGGATYEFMGTELKKQK